jgi:hypothetical protein
MYALTGRSAIYHLMDTKSGLTVCGQKVRKVRVAKKAKETPLHWTPTRPLDKAVCKHCVRLAAPEN